MVIVLGPDECWPWTGGLTIGGYGKFWLPPKAVLAHRVSFEIHYRLLLPREQALHSCDNPKCVNPRHLRAGTHQDNMDDRTLRGRHRKPGVKAQERQPKARTWETSPKGEHVNTAKLTPDIVRACRAAAASGTNYADLGRKYGVSRRNMALLCQGRTWKTVT